ACQSFIIRGARSHSATLPPVGGAPPRIGSALHHSPVASMRRRPSPTVCLRYDDLRLHPAWLLSKIHQRTFVSFWNREDAMAQEPLATKGNFLHIYDFRVSKGKEEEFIRSFEEFDYSDGNPMHKSRAQVKDGVLCRDTQDPQRFFLIAEW